MFTSLESVVDESMTLEINVMTETYELGNYQPACNPFDFQGPGVGHRRISDLQDP